MHQNETAISRHGDDSRPEHFGMKKIGSGRIRKALMLEETSQRII